MMNIPSSPPPSPTLSLPIPRSNQTMRSRNLPSPYARPAPGFAAATLTSPCPISTKFVSLSLSRPHLTLFSPSRVRSCACSPQVRDKTRPLAGASSLPSFVLSYMFVAGQSWTETSSLNKVRAHPSSSWCPMLLSKIIRIRSPFAPSLGLVAVLLCVGLSRCGRAVQL
jgi:hypothetical protein